MAQQLINGKQQFIDGNGNPLAGGSVAFYLPGTLTAVNTWQDQGLTVLNTNPVVLDANGMASIWGADGQVYRQIVKDISGNTIWDDETGGNAAFATIQAGLKNYIDDTGVANAYVAALTPPITSYVNGLSIIVKFSHANTGASTLNAGANAVPLLNDLGQPLLAGDIGAGSIGSFIYDSNLNAFLSVGIVPSQAMSQSAADSRYAALAGSLTQNFSAANLTVAKSGKLFLSDSAGTAHNAFFIDPGTNTTYLVDSGGSGGVVVANQGVTGFANLTIAPATSAQHATTYGQVFGLGQTWKNVTASRALGTNYTNSTGKTIFVCVYATGSPTNCVLTATVDGVTMGSQGVNAVQSAAMFATLSFAVPPGSSYSATNVNGATLQAWSELS